jgi:hypothetical protein
MRAIREGRDDSVLSHGDRCTDTQRAVPKCSSLRKDRVLRRDSQLLNVGLFLMTGNA